MDRELTPVEMAQSLHRLMGALIGMPMEWEKLSYEAQVPWLALASRGPAKLERLEGAPLKDVALQMVLLVMPPEEAERGERRWQEMPDKIQLAWEAVTRHLHMLCDCDDLPSPEESERMWAEWYARKTESLVLAGG